MGKHAARLRHLTPGKKYVAIVIASITAGAWIPFTTGTGPVLNAPDDDEDETVSVPPPICEGHQFPTWPVKAVPGNTQHDVAPTPPSKVAAPKPHPKATKPVVHRVTPAPQPHTHASIIIAFLRAQLGEPYGWGGNGPDVWDCSGLTKAAYARVGIHLPRTSQEQSLVGHQVSLRDLRVGDLLFWGSPGTAYHVAIYI